MLSQKNSTRGGITEQRGVRELLRDQKQGWERGGGTAREQGAKSNLHLIQPITYTRNCTDESLWGKKKKESKTQAKTDNPCEMHLQIQPLTVIQGA